LLKNYLALDFWHGHYVSVPDFHFQPEIYCFEIILKKM